MLNHFLLQYKGKFMHELETERKKRLSQPLERIQIDYEQFCKSKE